jgi:alpha-mannosidase
MLRPHQGGYSAAGAARFGMETTRPLIVARSDDKSGVRRPLLTSSTPDVLVETVKPSSDGKALIVRLFGVSAKTRTTRLDWQAIQPTSVSLTDLTEKPLRKLGRSVEVPAYGVMHLRAELPAVGVKSVLR